MATETVCAEYTTRTLDVHFPKDKVCCQLCPLLQTYSRNQCMRTGEFIPDTRAVGGWCPLVNENGEYEGAFYKTIIK